MGCPALCLLVLPLRTGAPACNGAVACGAEKRSNNAVERASPRAQKAPAGRASFEMVRGYDARSARADVSPEAARRPGAAPGFGGDPMRITKQTPAARRRETPLHAIDQRYNNTLT